MQGKRQNGGDTADSAGSADESKRRRQARVGMKIANLEWFAVDAVSVSTIPLAKWEKAALQGACCASVLSQGASKPNIALYGIALHCTVQYTVVIQVATTKATNGSVGSNDQHLA